MRSCDDPTLWAIRAFERHRRDTGGSGFGGLDGLTVLPTDLMADLDRILGDDASAEGGELEAIAACRRHRQPALMCLQIQGLVWPVTVFPAQRLYHCPRDLVGDVPAPALAELTLLSVEPPSVGLPRHAMSDRTLHPAHYRPLTPLLWALALHGPHRRLLAEIDGTARYRAQRDPSDDGEVASGALGSAVRRLRRESASLREIANWPGLSVERASRLLNALHLSTGLQATRTGGPARSEPGWLRNLFGRDQARPSSAATRA